MTKTEIKILNQIQNSCKKRWTFNRVQDGSRVMDRLNKMIKEGKLTVVAETPDWFWGCIGGCYSRHRILNITVEIR